MRLLINNRGLSVLRNILAMSASNQVDVVRAVEVRQHFHGPNNASAGETLKSCINAISII